MEKYLLRNYYEKDNAFYKCNAYISCQEQMEYQSLRDYDVDYFLVFCNDINIFLNLLEDNPYVTTHDFDYNKKIFTFQEITQKWSDAEKSITAILEMEKIVVFRTAMDYLHTSCWYRSNGPYDHILHRSIIIGENEKFYFYVDSPPMRNNKYFIPYKDNPTVGCIYRNELIESFKYYCSIGYIDIDEKELKDIADIKKILMGIKNSFYDCGNERFLIGKRALQKLADVLKNKWKVKQLFSDPFTFNLITSRHKKLKINLEKYNSNNKNFDICIEILEKLINRWEIVEKITMKMNIKYSEKDVFKIANLIEGDILKLTEEFVEYI